MATTPAGRLGDLCSHGAVLIAGSGTVVTDNCPAVRLGDVVSCPRHGPNPIIAVQTTVLTENRATTRISAIAHCGAELITGSADVLIGP